MWPPSARVAAAPLPRIENPTLKTYEKGAIVAHFNTDTFSGQRGATVTVTIDKPYYAEVQLHVSGYIRTDVMVDPGSVQFGDVDQGNAFLQKVNVNYNGGSSNWKIVDVKSDNPNLKAEVVETNRNYGQANYQLESPPGRENAGGLPERSADAGHQRQPEDSRAGRRPRRAERFGQSRRALHGRGAAGPKSDQAIGREEQEAVQNRVDHLRRQIVRVRYRRKKTPPSRCIWCP